MTRVEGLTSLVSGCCLLALGGPRPGLATSETSIDFDRLAIEDGWSQTIVANEHDGRRP